VSKIVDETAVLIIIIIIIINVTDLLKALNYEARKPRC
jgi:hypothetical protein